MKDRIFVQMITCFLLSLIVSFALTLSFSMNVRAELSGNGIDVNSEYSSGTIPLAYYGFSLWYTWINCNGTQLIYLACQPATVTPPVTTFLGQRYITENGDEVFVGNTLTGMEIYNDTDKNGIPEQSEVDYVFMVNSSASFEATPVQKLLVQGTAHYRWGTRYNGIDAFLLNDNQSESAKVILSYLEFSYDFSVQENESILKSNFGIGQITNVIYSNFNTNLDGLSLSLLYGTAILTPKPYETLVNGSSYNSLTAQTSTQPLQSGEIAVENVTAYEFLFGQNYTLSEGAQNQTIPSITVGTAQQSMSRGVYTPVKYVISTFETTLNDIFNGISSITEPFNLDYTNSSFLYRICYPTWDGNPIEHDPEYIAHLTTGNVALSTDQSLPWNVLTFAAVICSITFIGAIYDLRRTRKKFSSEG